MNRVSGVFLAMAVVAGLLAGCASAPEQLVDLNPKLVTVSRKDLERNPVSLPAGYNVENFRKLRLNVAFESITGRECVVDSTGRKVLKNLAVSQDLSARLQGEIARLKRFTVRSDFNRVAAKAEELRREAEVDKKDADLSLSCRVAVTKSKQKRYTDTVVFYEAEVDCSCEDLRSGDVKFSTHAKGVTTRAQMVSYSGRVTSGFDDSGESEMQAVVQASMKAIAEIANKLGNEYPVGGRIVGCSASGETMKLDKGAEEGIGADQECVVFTDDCGVDIPLANATAVPKIDGTSQLSVWRWNTSSPDAKPLVKRFRKDPKGFLNEFKVYAVGCGMPVPREWEKANRSAEEAVGARKR